MSDEPQNPTEIIARLAEQLSHEPRLNAELQRARRQFFGTTARRQNDDVVEHRFAEWFLFERESEALGAVPTDVEPYATAASALEGSISGLFLVESTGRTTTVRDVQDGEILELLDNGRLQPGDLLVGRLYPAAGERFSPSTATPALRPGRKLADAFLHDLKRLDLDRRLQQIELEHLLLREHGGTAVEHAHDPIVPGPPPAPIVPLEHLEADLEQLLQAAGDKHSATRISQQLALAQRPGAFIGPLLDQLAFDTQVDLDRARQVMLEIWNAHHAGEAGDTAVADAPAAATSGPPGESLGERLVRTLDQGLGEKRDVEDLFRQLERIAGIEAEDDDDQEDDERGTAIVDAFAGIENDATLDVGDLGPLIQEYQWETGAEQADGGSVERSDLDHGALKLWVELQQNAPVPNTDFESIATPDIMRLLLHVYLRSAPGERAEQVRGAFAELEGFYRWVHETQEMDRLDTLRGCRGTLLDELDRLQEAGLALATDAAPDTAPGLLQVEELGGDGFGARDDDGSNYWIAAGDRALRQLRVGDLLLAGFVAPDANAPSSLHRRLAGLVVVLPIDARSLID